MGDESSSWAKVASIVCAADDARLVDVLPGEAEVGGGRFAVPVWNGNVLTVARTNDLPPFLRGVVLVGETCPSLRSGARGLSGEGARLALGADEGVQAALKERLA